MTKLSELSVKAIRERLHNDGLILKIGPFSFRIQSKAANIVDGLVMLYGDYQLPDANEFVDFTVLVRGGAGLRRWFGQQAIFDFDGTEPFTPLPVDQAFALLEWAMNWCIATQVNHFLLLHSAVIEREDCAVILPAPPGSGKSTLCAGLVNRGWRLLSDELAVISLDDASIHPLGRPISLKNQSIDVIRNYVQGAVLNRVTHDTSKGSVTHLKVLTDHVNRMGQAAQPRWVVFPKYVASAEARLTSRSKANSMLELGLNSFNYMALGLDGFQTLRRVIDASDCYDFEYSQLDDAVTVFDDLVRRRERA